MNGPLWEFAVRAAGEGCPRLSPQVKSEKCVRCFGMSAELDSKSADRYSGRKEPADKILRRLSLSMVFSP